MKPTGRRSLTVWDTRTNITLTMSAKARIKLSALKLRLREAGLAPSLASESAIVERLVVAATLDDLLALFT